MKRTPFLEILVYITFLKKNVWYQGIINRRKLILVNDMFTLFPYSHIKRNLLKKKKLNCCIRSPLNLKHTAYTNGEMPRVLW